MSGATGQLLTTAPFFELTGWLISNVHRAKVDLGRPTRERRYFTIFTQRRSRAEPTMVQGNLWSESRPGGSLELYAYQLSQRSRCASPELWLWFNCLSHPI